MSELFYQAAVTGRFFLPPKIQFSMLISDVTQQPIFSSFT